MTSFSTLLSSLGDKPEAPTQSSANVSKSTSTQPDRRANGATDRFKLTPNNAAAGVKRKSQEPETVVRPKIIKTEQNGLPSRPAAAPASRFQLSAKPSAAGRPTAAVQRPAIATASTSNPQRPLSKLPPRPAAAGTLTPPGTADGSAKPKKGFAAMLEKAKAAEAAAKTSGIGGIKHKAVEKLSRRERERMKEEALAQQKAAKKSQLAQIERSRSGTPNVAGKPGVQKKAPESAYKGTMKKAAPEPVAYKGTMGKVRSGPQPAPKKGMAQDKYGGYASWSDLDDAEEEADEPDDYDSEDDMEGGFDDVEAEETAALRAARREDQEALEEEERLKREKLERKRRLQALSKTAAARKKF
ncbi:hypothetical protein LTR85_008477 [Meristemomyces frigidus]|nr:hypothetical protein LTR85_008477 [Meristemomyces frigidus]